MKRYSMPSHMPDKFPFIDRKMWEKPKMDIVERLRQNTMLSDSIEKEAADEIERLREALNKWWAYSQTDYEDHTKMMLDWADAVKTTRSALQQKDSE